MLDVEPRFFISSRRKPELEPTLPIGDRRRAGVVQHAHPRLRDGAPFDVMGTCRDVAADFDQLTQHCVLAHDTRIGADIGRTRRFFNEPS